jgi:hypothetical protein
MILILMHQMRISTIYVSSEMLRPKCITLNCKELEQTKPKTECNEMDPSPSKDRAMHKGDSP